MSERESAGSDASSGSTPPGRVMRVAPIDLRQARFKNAVRGFNRTEVVAFLTEAADDYESALREIDRLRQDLARSESLLVEHREREGTLRNTLVTAQKLADEIKESAENEARLILREAQGRADLLAQQAQGNADLLVQQSQRRVEEMERGINELRLRRRDAEGTLESTIQALQRALTFIREQDAFDGLLSRGRTTDGAPDPSPPVRS